MFRRSALVCSLAAFCVLCLARVKGADSAAQENDFQQVREILNTYCSNCHRGDSAEADVNIEQLESDQSFRRNTALTQKVVETLEQNQMPPADSQQPSESERLFLKVYLNAILKEEADKFAGDPGPVVLRRLNNVEYTNSIRDLTGIETLDPAKEFPLDGAAGEGFTNAGNALSMSPALITKYLDAARDVSQHAVLLPDGIRFSSSTSRRDWTEEIISDIRKIYAKYSAKTGATQVNLQGIVFDTNDGGRLPLALYLQAIVEEGELVDKGLISVEQIARKRDLSPKYLQMLFDAIRHPQGSLMSNVASQLNSNDSKSLESTIRMIEAWQKSLWRFSSVGHIGKKNGPTRWMETVNPLSHGQEFRISIPQELNATNANEESDVVLYLSTTDAGDGSEGDVSVWEKPRFVLPGRPDILLRDCGVLVPHLKSANAKLLKGCKRALAAADWFSRQSKPIPIVEIADKFQCDEDLLHAWFAYLGLRSTSEYEIQGHLKSSLQKVAGYDFVSGWSEADALSVIANSSSEHVRIPGNLAPHSLVVHPAPTVQMVVGWSSPIRGLATIKGTVQHAHPECGNGVQWTLQLRRSSTIQNLASGIAHGAEVQVFDVPKPLLLSEHDVLCLVIDPRNGNHSCDATAVQMIIEEISDEAGKPVARGSRRWDLCSDVSSDILQGNPHKDSHGNMDVWHFFGEPVTGSNSVAIPSGSLLAQWQSASESQERLKIAEELERSLIASLESNDSANAISHNLSEPDKQLFRQLRSLAGPLMNFHLAEALAGTSSIARGPEISLDIVAEAPGKSIEVRVPASLVAGSEFVTYGRLADRDNSVGSVQMNVSLEPSSVTSGVIPGDWKETSSQGKWSDGVNQFESSRPIIVSQFASTQTRIRDGFDMFRELFPAALCYNKIIPVDEVVTLTLYYREDDALCRLMLTDEERAQLDRLWNELHYVSRDALSLVDAYDQLWQYATQDADPSAFEPLRQPIMDRAIAFRQELADSEPKHLVALHRIASKAFRRPLSKEEEAKLNSAYRMLRSSDLDHETSIRGLLTKILISPAFLYKSEKGDGDILTIAGGNISIRELTDWELATRLSYMLTGSLPDQALLQMASSGSLRDPEVLKQQASRLLKTARARSFATEFGCQWLQIYQFDEHDEKSDATFPEFASIRGSMYQESILFWLDLFQNDKSLLEVLNADYAFVDESLAKHYGIDWESATAIDTSGFSGWRRIDRSKRYDRGGVLTMGSVLSKQSGASRTSPILRGNWISEVLLGEKLPKPPKNVPVLPEIAPDGLTERQLIEMHSSAPACAKCHERIDPFGFAWESFDAIGRRRDPARYDTQSKLPDGTTLEGWLGLRDYLIEKRLEDFSEQFCKKLLGFALGRAVQLSDQDLIDSMVKSLKEHDYHVSAALNTILESQQFRFIRTDGQQDRQGASDE